MRNFFQINDEAKYDVQMTLGTLGAVAEKEQESDLRKDFNEIKLPV